MSRKRTSYTRNAHTAIATADIQSEMCLVATDGTEDRVKPSAGTAGEKFAGFANMNAKTGEDVGRKVDGSLATPVAVGAVAFLDPVKPAANGGVTVCAANDAARCGTAQSVAVDGEPVTVESY